MSISSSLAEASPLTAEAALSGLNLCSIYSRLRRRPYTPCVWLFFDYYFGCVSIIPTRGRTKSRLKHRDEQSRAHISHPFFCLPSVNATNHKRARHTALRTCIILGGCMSSRSLLPSGKLKNTILFRFRCAACFFIWFILAENAPDLFVLAAVLSVKLDVICSCFANFWDDYGTQQAIREEPS